MPLDGFNGSQNGTRDDTKEILMRGYFSRQGGYAQLSIQRRYTCGHQALVIPLECLRKELMNQHPTPQPSPITRFTPMSDTSNSVFMGKFWKLEYSQEVEVLRHLYRGTLICHLRVFYFKPLEELVPGARFSQEFSPVLTKSLVFRLCLPNSDQLNTTLPLGENATF